MRLRFYCLWSESAIIFCWLEGAIVCRWFDCGGEARSFIGEVNKENPTNLLSESPTHNFDG